MQTNGQPQTELPSNGVSSHQGYPDRVLVVAEDQVVRQALDALISIEGCEVRTESDPARAVQTAVAWEPGLVLLDADPTEVNARRLVEEIHDRASRSIPVVLLSSQYLGEHEWLGMGASGFVPKPFSVDQLLETVQQFANC